MISYGGTSDIREIINTKFSIVSICNSVPLSVNIILVKDEDNNMVEIAEKPVNDAAYC